jgi:hypothetical protein
MGQGKSEGAHSMRSHRSGVRIPLAAALASLSLVTVLAVTAASSAAPIPGPAAGVTPGVAGSVVDYTATDGSVWATDTYPSAPEAIVSYGGHLVSGPAPISTTGDSSAQTVFGQGTDDQLWWTQGANSSWAPLGGVLTSKPGAANVDATTYSVFARGSDGAVWERDHGGSQWDAWHSLGGQVLAGTGPAAAYTSGDGETWVAVTGTDHAVWYLNLASNIPQNGWASLQGKTNASPGLTAPAASSLAAFARGADNAGYYNEIIGGAQGWHSIGGRLTSGLAASSSNGTSVFGLGTDNQMYETNGTFPAFGPWTFVNT